MVDSRSTSDEDLMCAAGRGDMAAFGELVRIHHGSAYRVAYRFLNEPEEARDVAQDAFVKILGASARYRPTAAFKTYLYGVVARLCEDRRRKFRPILLPELPEAADPGPSPLDALDAREKEAAVSGALATLPPRQRMAVVLHYFEGLGYRDLAIALDTSPKAAERLLGRARDAPGHPPLKP